MNSACSYAERCLACLPSQADIFAISINRMIVEVIEFAVL